MRLLAAGENSVSIILVAFMETGSVKALGQIAVLAQRCRLFSLLRILEPFIWPSCFWRLSSYHWQCSLFVRCPAIELDAVLLCRSVSFLAGPKFQSNSSTLQYDELHFPLYYHRQVHYEDIFGEPEAVRSHDCVWRNSYKCFNGTFACCYKFLTLLCAIPLACCWGCEFACTACYHVWYLTPYLRWFEMCMMHIRRLFTLCLESFLAPLMETCGLCLSKIVVKNWQVQGLL